MNNEVTMADIGRKLGVSTVTVSKALSGKGGVSEELKEKILNEARLSGYQKSKRHEKKRDQQTIGVIVSERFISDNNSFYWKMYQDLMFSASNLKVFTLLEVISTDAEKNLKMPNLYVQGKADGIIILGPISEKYSSELSAKGNIPIVCLDSQYETIVADAVVCDNVAGGYTMTRYLLDRGHTKIGYLGSLNATPSIDNRYLGYIKALIRAGIRPEWKWQIDDRDVSSGVIGAEGTYDLPYDDMPTAFFCNCDLAAAELIRRLKKNGYSVPEDISVVGFDNYVPESDQAGKITTYEIDMMSMAEQALRSIVKRIEEPDSPQQVIVLRGHIVEKSSVEKM